MEAIFSSERPANFQLAMRSVSQKGELFITTEVRTSNLTVILLILNIEGVTDIC
jgi:hypothetical protein